MYLSRGCSAPSVAQLRGTGCVGASPALRVGGPEVLWGASASCLAGTGIAVLSSRAVLRRLHRLRAAHARALAGASGQRQQQRQHPSAPRLCRTARRVFDRFREDAITAIYCAQEEAIRQGYGVVRTELVLLGILAEEESKGGRRRPGRSALVQSGVTREAVSSAMAELAAQRGGVAPNGGSGSLPFSDNARRLFDLANAEAKDAEVGDEQLLLALSRPALAECGAARILDGLGVGGARLAAAVEAELRRPGPEAGAPRQLAVAGAGADGATRLALDDVATDLTQMAMDGLLDPLVGREAELQRLVQVLLRRRKNNACLVGPPGVGKTAVAEGLAQRIADGAVPAKLRGKRVYSLDLGAIVAGTKYRGEFEERLKNVIAEASDAEKGICLFIDEIHQLVGAGVAGADSSMDAANLLKPALARGELQVIGATTADEYVRHVEKDGALERRFQKVVCEEPSVADTAKILEGLRASYEAHHGVLVAPEALGAAARLSHRYLPERFLPDKAIDLLDEAGSIAQLRQEAAQSDASAADEKKTLVTASDIAAVLSRWSGVPVERLTEDQARFLLRLEDRIAEQIIGQREAVSALGRAVRRARAGLAGSRRPIASLYFAGPTGVGKTELCRVLASEYYADSKALIRLDMSEYSEQHSVSRLVGPPPGYVGYDDPRSGQLTEAVRRRPYSVVVLDEIEKAHPEVLNLLLQVLEDGRLTDGKGRTVSFTDCIVIMTSNVGSRDILEQAHAGGGYPEMRAAVQGQLQRRFRPEFINRIDEILVFGALSPSELRGITRLLLRDAAERAQDAQEEEAMRQGSASQSSGLRLKWTAGLEDAVLEQGSGVAYGARPLRRAVQRLFEDPLAELLVDGALAGGGEASVDLEGGIVVVRYAGGTLRPSLAAAAVEGPASGPEAGLQPLEPAGVAAAASPAVAVS